MELTNRQNEIIDAAIRLIADKGIQELTIKKLALSIGITEPAIYRHFIGKAEIVRSLIRRFDEAFPEDQCNLTGFSAIRAFVENRVDLLMLQPALAKVMFTEEFFIGDPEFSEQMRAMMHRHKEWMSKRLSEGMAEGTIRSDISSETLFRLIMGPVRLLFKQWGMCDMKFDLRQQSRNLLDTLELLLGRQFQKSEKESEKSC